jgi:hypothetical protein
MVSAQHEPIVTTDLWSRRLGKASCICALASLALPLMPVGVGLALAGLVQGSRRGGIAKSNFVGLALNLLVLPLVWWWLRYGTSL